MWTRTDKGFNVSLLLRMRTGCRSFFKIRGQMQTQNFWIRTSLVYIIHVFFCAKRRNRACCYVAKASGSGGGACCRQSLVGGRSTSATAWSQTHTSGKVSISFFILHFAQSQEIIYFQCLWEDLWQSFFNGQFSVDSVILGTVENHRNPEVMETVIFVKCCDSAKMLWFYVFC